ncbi:uncharacterized protein LOC127059923 [Serinus canaria]|uniref:uncharacterized protein LOC127059923 n=1 Tax=Serinus canaria TaxID=9135 RepID=UPI0021CCB12B|nr:uncharacterized protein LOC127059923 [Serinus canaria]
MGVPPRVELFPTGWLIAQAIASIMLPNLSWGTGPPKGPLAPQMTKGAPQGRGCPLQCLAFHRSSPRQRRGRGWWGLSLVWEEVEPTMRRKKPKRSWLKPFYNLDRGHQSSFDGPSLLPLFQQSLTDGVPDNTPVFCPALLASFLFAFPPSSSMSDGAALGQEGSGQAVGLSVMRALCPSKGTNKRPAVPAWLGGFCGNTTVSTLGSCFLPAPRLWMQRSLFLPQGQQDKANSQFAKGSGTCLGAFNYPDNGIKRRRAMRPLQSQIHRGGFACCSHMPGASTCRLQPLPKSRAIIQPSWGHLFSLGACNAAHSTGFFMSCFSFVLWQDRGGALLPERGVPRSGPRLGQSRHVNTTTGAAEEPGAALELLRVSRRGAAARRERKAGERGGRRARTDRRREAAREPRRRRGGPAGGRGRAACGSARDLDGPRSAGTGQTCPPPAAYRPPLIGQPAAGPCWRHRSRPAPRGGCSNALAFLSFSSLCR